MFRKFWFLSLALTIVPFFVNAQQSTDDDRLMDYVWGPATGDVDKYEIWIAIDSTTDDSFKWLGDVVEPKAKFVARPNHVYYVKVRARDAAGNTGAFSEISEPILVKLAANYVLPPGTKDVLIGITTNIFVTQTPNPTVPPYLNLISVVSTRDWFNSLLTLNGLVKWDKLIVYDIPTGSAKVVYEEPAWQMFNSPGFDIQGGLGLRILCDEGFSGGTLRLPGDWLSEDIVIELKKITYTTQPGWRVIAYLPQEHRYSTSVAPPAEDHVYIKNYPSYGIAKDNIMNDILTLGGGFVTGFWLITPQGVSQSPDAPKVFGVGSGVGIYINSLLSGSGGTLTCQWKSLPTEAQEERLAAPGTPGKPLPVASVPPELRFYLGTAWIDGAPAPVGTTITATKLNGDHIIRPEENFTARIKGYWGAVPIVGLEEGQDFDWFLNEKPSGRSKFSGQMDQVLELFTSGGDTETLPDKTELLQNYPNPSSVETWIPYALAEDIQVRIHIYDLTGHMVRILEGAQEKGWYTAKSKAAYWDGRNELGEKVASGVYFYTMQFNGTTTPKKMLILK